MNVDFVNDPDLLVLSGSQLYGYATPESDEDLLGFVRPPIEREVGMIHRFEQKTPSQEDLDAGDDRKVYSLRKFLTQLSRNDTQCLEILFAPATHIRVCTEIGQMVINARDMFVTKQLYKRFAGYAYSEFRKVRAVAEVPQKQTPDEKTLIDQIRNTFRPTKKVMDGVLDLLYEDKPKKQVSVYHKLGAARKSSIDKFGYSVKNAAHCIRLLAEGVELLSTGNLVYPLSPKVVSLLRQIRAGELKFEEVEAIFHQYEEDLKKACDASCLPEKVDMEEVNALFLDLTLDRW